MTDTRDLSKRRQNRPRKVPGVIDAGSSAAVPDAVAAPLADVAAAAPIAAPASASQDDHSTTAVPSPAHFDDPSPGPAATTAPINEGSEFMATIAPAAATVNDASDKAQAAFGDAAARVKTAFEKSTKISEELADFTRGNVEALIASARVAAKVSESLGQDAAEYGKKNFESASAAFKNFASVKSPTELFQLQSDYAKASFDNAVAEASKLSESLLKAFSDIAQPLSTRYAVAAEKIKSATL